MGLSFSNDTSGVFTNNKQPPHNLVVFEVLGGHVRNAEWRMGDWWTKGVLGLSRPYVNVVFGAQCGQSASKITFTGDVNFHKCMVFSLDDSDDVEHIKITVRDKRNVQALLRGNPLVGTGEVRIDQASAGTLRHDRVELRRNDSQDSTGWVTVQYRVVKREVVRNTLLSLGARSLRDIAGAMVGVMRSPDGVKQLLKARPEKVAPRTCTPTPNSGGSQQEKNLRRRMEPLTASFCVEADSFNQETDDEVLGRLAPLSRDILKVVADFAQLENGEELDTVELAMEWFEKLFNDLAEVNQSVAGSDPSLHSGERLERLHRWFLLSHIDPDNLEPVDAGLRTINGGSPWQANTRPPKRSLLGSGTYGCVFRAMDRETKQVCAVKQMLFQAGRVDEAVTMRDCEVAEVLCSGKHPCVVKLFSVHQHAETCAILIMEYCSGGDLQGAILSHRKSNLYNVPPQANKWLAQIFLGLEFLHLSVRMLVRDVKPQNVLLTTDGFCAKLTDFGMSRLDTVSDGVFTFEGVPPGTPLYIAPEVIKGEGYDYHADLYSLAVLAWVLYTGGVVSKAVPVPPCAQFDQRRGLIGLVPLLKNWQILKACIENPEKNDAHPLPSEDIKDFILCLTDRKENYQQLSHEEVRSQPHLQIMAPPAHNNPAEVMLWLRNLRAD